MYEYTEEVFFYGEQLLVGQVFLIIEASLSRSDTPQSVGLLWIRPTQRPVPDNTQLLHETDIRAPGGIRSRNPGKRAATDPHLRMKKILRTSFFPNTTSSTSGTYFNQ